MAWRSAFGWFLASSFGLVLLLYAFIVLADPYDSLPLSLPFERAPAADDQRFVYPALARNDAFNAYLFGTSMSRLLMPEELNRRLGTSLANLSMDSATSFEQRRLLDLALGRKAQPGLVIIAADTVYCRDPAEYRRYRADTFPEWLYDADPWNDYLHVFSLYGLETAARQVIQALGLRAFKYGRDGFRNFLPPDEDYDAERARSHQSPLGPENGADEARGFEPLDREAAARFALPGLADFEAMAAALRPETALLVLFPPPHAGSLPVAESLEALRWRACKTRIAELAASRPNTAVMDMRFRNAMTEDETLYWDALHYRVSVARRIEAALEAVLSGAPLPEPAIARVLHDGLIHDGLIHGGLSEDPMSAPPARDGF